MTRQRPCGFACRTAYRTAWGPAAAIMLMCLLAACATAPGPGASMGAGLGGIPVAQEAAAYRAHARRYYAPPGPAGDPWGPYIQEASRRFDVPDIWIRTVMFRESGGHEFINGQFVTSVPGAMGLMQLMPPTYDDMRGQYGLGADPYEPHDNILAGTAYLRQMYDIYGSPGFLAAYNTGPGRLDDFLTRNRALPHETRQYVAIIGPQIAGIYPNSRSQADLMVMNHQYADAAVTPTPQRRMQRQPGTDRSVRMAWARKRDHQSGLDQPIQVAEAPSAGRAPSINAVWAARLGGEPKPLALALATPTRVTQTRATTTRLGRFHLIEPAMAVTPRREWRLREAGPHDWAIQVGAFGTPGQASQAAGSARLRAHVVMADVRTEIAGIHAGRAGHIYRARLTGLSRDDAMQACQKLNRGRSECMVISPDSRS